MADARHLTPPILERMQTIVDQWETCADRKVVFLRCYRMMTANMLAALDGGEFADRAWVEKLLHHFAGYYFDALEAYERAPEATPAVWQLAHDACCDADVWPIQHLLLGVNAHINYDLVLTVADLLEPEWDELTPERRALRYTDHVHVNRVIAGTVDAVQDDVLDPVMPSMGWLDTMMGPLDELLISRVITGWRERVWANATTLLDGRARGYDARVLARVEADALRLGRRIRYGVFG